MYRNRAQAFTLFSRVRNDYRVQREQYSAIDRHAQAARAAADQAAPAAHDHAPQVSEEQDVDSAPGEFNDAEEQYLHLNNDYGSSHMALSVKYFDEYAREKKLKFPKNGPGPTYSHLLRFLEHFVSVRARNSRNKSFSYGHVRRCMEYLVDHCMIKHGPNSHLTEASKKDIVKDLDKLIRQGKASIATDDRERSRFTPTVARLMIEALIIDTMLSGINNSRLWGVTSVVILAILSLTSSGLRAGDVMASDKAAALKGFYTQLSDVRLFLPEGSSRKIKNLVAYIHFRHTKGEKDKENGGVEIRFEALGSHYCMCFITMLVAHALRHRLVRATTVAGLLRDIQANGDIEWLYPKRPLIPKWSRRGSGRVYLDRPAEVTHLRNVVKVMGQAIDIDADLCHTHAFRRGFANVACKLPVGVMQRVGLDVEAAALILGHESRTDEVTRAYIGDSPFPLNAIIFYHDQAEEEFDVTSKVQLRCMGPGEKRCKRIRTPTGEEYHPDGDKPIFQLFNQEFLKLDNEAFCSKFATIGRQLDPPGSPGPWLDNENDH